MVRHLFIFFLFYRMSCGAASLFQDMTPNLSPAVTIAQADAKTALEVALGQLDTNEYVNLNVTCAYTNQATLLLNFGSQAYVSSLSIPIKAMVTNALSFTNQPVFDSQIVWTWVTATNAAGSAMSSDLHTPFPPTQLVLSWPQIGAVKILSATTVNSAWSTFATPATNSFTTNILSANRYFRLLQPTNTLPVKLSIAGVNPANTNVFGL